MAGISNNDKKIFNILQSILIGRYCLTEKEFRDEYGSDLLEYIFLHENYDYSSGINPILETDKKIQLIDNGELKEIELSLNNDNSFELGKFLREKIRGKIDFEKYYVVETGKYRGTSQASTELSFYYEFRKDEFLRVEISSFYNHKNSIGEKLSALSSFYEVLDERYGEPTIFYNLKDEEGTLALYWSFLNKEEEIQKFKNGKYFDDREIDKLIVIDEMKEKISTTEIQKIIFHIHMYGHRVSSFWELGALAATKEIKNYIKHKFDLNVDEEDFEKEIPEDMMHYIVSKVLNDNLGTPLYDNDMELGKKPEQL